MKTTRTAAVVAAWTAVGVLGAAALTGVATADEQPGTAPAVTGAAGTELGAGDGEQRARWRVLAGRVLHGEATVKAREGSAEDYRQVATQLGTLTAVSKGSITVRSEDGITWTWALTTDTAVRTGRQAASLSDLEGGVAVRVAGPVDDGSRTARLVVLRPGTASAG